MSTQCPPLRMRHEYHKTPVTALAFWTDYLLLSGEGTSIVVYDVSTRESLGSAKVFESQTVHGILTSRDSNDILIYGGSLLLSCAIVFESHSEVAFSFSRVRDVGDWILDAAFSPPSEGLSRCAALVTAHNALVRCIPPEPSLPHTDSDIEVRVIVPGSNSILYCAQVSWLGTSQCLIASGTAFGDVIVWSSLFSHGEFQETEATSHIHYTFGAHEGSVFGVQISSLLSPLALPGCSRALVTCSDDRTIRLYDISDLSNRSATLAKNRRDTGFGSTEDSNAEAPPLLAKAMGHISRIWAVRFITNSRLLHDTSLQIASFGEDASRIAWDIETGEDVGKPPQYSLRQRKTEHLHIGKNMWAVAIRDKRCATGGADGSIASLPAVAREPNIHEISQSVLSPPPDNIGGERHDSFKSFALLSADVLIATTSSGRIVTLDLRADGNVSMQLDGTHESLRAYSVVTSCDGFGFASGTKGDVYTLGKEMRVCAPVTEIDGKTAGLFASRHANPMAVKMDQSHQVLLTTTVGASIASLTELRLYISGASDRSYSKTDVCTLGLPSGFVTTSFTMIRLHRVQYAVLGSRNGSLAVYPYGRRAPEPRSAKTDEAPTSLLGLISHVHGSDAVTALRWVADNDEGEPAETRGFLLSTGRNGTYAVHHIYHSDQSPSFELVHQLELPFGPNIEGLDITASGHFWVWGFKSKNFVVHDATTQRDVMIVNCGGAKRNWSYYPTEQGGTFVWTKVSQVLWTTQTELPYHSINSGGHGREIKAVAVSPGESQIIATGAEDTDIKLFKYDSRQRFMCLQTLRKHSTGIQHLQWSADGRYLFSSGGLEEFCVWKITPEVPYVGVGVVCESMHPASGTSDLRIMGFDVRMSAHDVGDPGTRGCFEITMAYSDSVVKFWRYWEGQWTLLSSGDYLTACLMDVLSLSPSSPRKAVDGFATTLTSSSDGHLALWRQESTDGLAWLSRHRVHQNAVLCTVSERLSNGAHLIATGGDDNGIGLTIMSGAGRPSTLLLPRAHAAAVTAIALLSLGSDRFWLCSTGIDQRVKLWEISIDVKKSGLEGLEIVRRHNAPTSVADVSSMDLIRLEDGGTGVLLCGVGMDLWSLPDLR